jgi:hypothetical protein
MMPEKNKETGFIVFNEHTRKAGAEMLQPLLLKTQTSCYQPSLNNLAA